MDTPVLISGAGPVGLVLALDMARRGVGSIVIERRRAGEPPSVKCNHVASRTMEAFRRLGLARTVRDAGLPADYPNDCVYRTTVTAGAEITRIPIPARAARWTDRRGAPAHIASLLGALSPPAGLVTVIDGHPATLSWLGAVRGQRVSPLGVERFGQTGDLPDTYALHRRDANAICDAMADLFL